MQRYKYILIYANIQAYITLLYKINNLINMFKLREFRLAHSLKQSEIAEILGVAQSGISRMESEKIELPKVLYKKLYDRFGEDDVDSFRLIDDDETKPSADLRLRENDNKELIAVIQKQNDMICEHIKRQDDLNKRLIELLEKLCIK